MNKTRKRAIEKHRAKARKYDALRKSGGNQQAVAVARRGDEKSEIKRET